MCSRCRRPHGDKLALHNGFGRIPPPAMPLTRNPEATRTICGGDSGASVPIGSLGCPKGWSEMLRLLASRSERFADKPGSGRTHGNLGWSWAAGSQDSHWQTDRRACERSISHRWKPTRINAISESYCRRRKSGISVDHELGPPQNPPSSTRPPGLQKLSRRGLSFFMALPRWETAFFRRRRSGRRSGRAAAQRRPGRSQSLPPRRARS